MVFPEFSSEEVMELIHKNLPEYEVTIRPDDYIDNPTLCKTLTVILKNKKDNTESESSIAFPPGVLPPFQMGRVFLVIADAITSNNPKDKLHEETRRKLSGAFSKFLDKKLDSQA